MKNVITYIPILCGLMALSTAYSQTTNIITASDKAIAPVIDPNTLITKSGKQYANYQIVRADPDGLNIKFSAGIAKIPFEELPDDLQVKYKFNPVTADWYRSTRAAQQNEYARKQRANYLERERQAAETKQAEQEQAKHEAKIKAGIISLGMSKSDVLRAWGKPNDINRTVGDYGTSEQWVYGNEYIYFDNGTVTAWQD